MTITNKDLDDKLEKIYERINKLFSVTSENGKSIAVLAEHVGMQNSRVGKNETRIDGMEGSLTEHEGEIKDIYLTQKSCLERYRKSSERKWDREMAKFGGFISIGTGSIVGIILLIARVLWGL